ncbi:uncharacterized protein LOC134772775 isoform X1 [Penaeus indicus]|uniref:uncharacterized protein LOC134772775 isoform X1 n=1 Tax=Penaeus indicus TaxID=29960 RepID=UPI00300C0CD0
MWHLVPMLLALSLYETWGYSTQDQVGELSVRRIVNIEAQGVSPCITLPDGSAPNLALRYETVFLKDGRELVNMTDLHCEPDVTGPWNLYCSAPVSLSELYFADDLVLMVLARSEDNLVVAAAEEELSLKNVTVDLRQEGQEALRVGWNQEPGRTYFVQIWTVPSQAHGSAPPTNFGDSRHHFGNRTETPQVVEVSGNVRCKNGQCLYYFLGLIDCGEYAVEVLDVTENIFQTSRSRRHSVDQHWTGLTIERVVIETSSPDSQRPLKTLTTTARTDEGLLVEEGFRAVLINALDPSDFLESDEGDCLPFTIGCKINDVQTLTHPSGEDQVTALQLLLTQQDQAFSSLVPVEDLQVRVTSVGPGSVQVSWEKTGVSLQFLVQLLSDKGGPAISLTVTCGNKAPNCQAVFDELVNGDYTAMVSYEGAVETQLTVPFQVKNGGVDCQLPFEDLAGHCVMVDAVILGTWDEVRLFCHQLGGQLAKLDDLEFMYHVAKYIRDNGIDNHSYWIGGSDTASEGDFTWLDGERVKEGTPYWSYVNGTQRPAFDSSLNCIALGQPVFHYFVDSSCSDSNAAVCEKVV